MRRRFGQFLDKYVERPRSTSPSSSKSQGVEGQSSMTVSSSVSNHRALKDTYQTVQHEGLKLSITHLIEFLDGVNGSLDTATFLKLQNELRELCEILPLLSEDRNSTVSQIPIENLAREIDAAVKNAQSRISYPSTRILLTKPDYTKAISSLSDGLHTSIENYRVQSASTYSLSPPATQGTARAMSGKVVGALSIAKEMLDGVPVPGLKAAVGGLLEVLGAINKLIDNDDDLVKLIDHIQRLVGIVRKPIQDNKNTQDPSLEQRVKDLTNDIQQITAHAMGIKEQNLGSKFLGRADNASAITGLSVAVDRAVDRFQVSGTMGIERGIGEIRGGVGSVREGVERLEVGSKGVEKELKNIKDDIGLLGKGVGRIGNMLEYKWVARISESEEAALNAIHPRVDSARYDSALQTSSSFCLEETRVALLKEIEEWAEDPNSRPIFWLCGMAGTGKTTIARTVAKRFDGSNRLGASFFFSRDEDDRRTTNVLFPTIAHQLALHNPSLREHVVGAATQHVCTAMLRTQLNKLIVEPLQRANPQSSPLVIVMDALDECDKESQITEMLVLLAPAIQVIRNTINIKLFLTSRPQIHISSEFKEPGMEAVSNVSVLHDIEKSLVRADITRFIEHHLQRIARLMLPRHTYWPTSEEKEALVDMADGLFIFASVTIGYVGDTKHRQPKQRLRKILSSLDQNQPSVSLKYLDILYRQILVASFPDSDEDEDSVETLQRIRVILGTVAFVFYPLSSCTLERLLQWEEDTVEPTLAPFHSVLSIPPDPEPVRVFHKSFPDFLTDKGRSGDLYIGPTEHHARIALLCLTHLNSTLQRDMCGVGNRLLSEINDVEAILQTKVQGHVLYACRYWAAHLEETTWTAELGAALKDFCDNKLLYWLEILCLDRKLSSGILALDSARRWTQDESSCASLDNCSRYLLYHQPTISLGPSHIYQSTLPFIPRKNLSSSPWEKELHRSPRIVMTDDHDTWDRILFTLTGHVRDVRAVAYSPDGTLLATSSFDKTIIWDSRTAGQIHSLGCDSDSVVALGFSPDGKLIASGDYDGRVCIWSTVTGVLVYTLRGHVRDVTAVSFSPRRDIIASASSDKTVILWSSGTGSHIRTLNGCSYEVSSIAFSRDGAQIVSTCRDLILIQDTETGAVVSKLKQALSAQHNTSVTFSPDGTRLASSSNNEVTLWDYQSLRPVKRLELNKGMISCIAFSQDGRFVIAGGDMAQLVAWDITSGLQIEGFGVHSRRVTSMAISPDGFRIITCSYDGPAEVYDMRSDWGKTIDPDKKIHTDAVYCVAFSPDGNEVAYGGEDGTVTVWNIGRHAMIHSLKGHKRAVLTVAFSTDGKHLASGSHHEIVVWNVEDGGKIKTLHPRGYVQNVGFSCDGVYLVASHEPTLTTMSINSRRYSKWRTKDLKQCKPLSFKSKEVVKVLKGSPYIGAPPSGTYLAKAEDSQWVEKRSQGITVERLCHLPHHDITASASFGRYFAFGTRRGTIYVLDFPPELFGITSNATAMNRDQQLLFGPDSDAVDSALESDSDSMVPAFGSESDSD